MADNSQKPRPLKNVLTVKKEDIILRIATQLSKENPKMRKPSKK